MSKAQGLLVQVHLYAAARAAAAPVIEAEPGTIESILAQCIDQYPALSTIAPQCSFLIDGTATIDLAENVAPGSQLDVLPRFAGGA